MSDASSVRREFLLKHWEGFRAELTENIARYVEVERYALIATGAIWTWLAGVADEIWNPALMWLPLVLNVFFSLRGFGLVLRAREISGYLEDAENYFEVPPKLALEQRSNKPSLKMFSVWSFWPLLLLVTAALPLSITM